MDVVWVAGLVIHRASMLRGVLVVLSLAVAGKLLFDVLLPLRLDGQIRVPYVGCVAPLLLALGLVLFLNLGQTSASVARLR